MSNQIMNMDFAAAEQRVMAHMMSTKVINGVPMMSHLQISQLTGVRQDNVKRTMDDLINEGVISFTQIEENPAGSLGGRPIKVYYVNERDSHVVVGKISAAYLGFLVDFWMAHRNPVAPQFKLPDFTNPAAAARAWADEMEAKQMLQAKVTEDAPKVAYAEAVGDSGGCLNLTETAKSFKLGPQKFIEFLRQTKRIYKRGNENLPLQDYVDAGVFKVKTIPIKNGNALATQTLVTGKGQEVLLRHVRKYQQLGSYGYLIGTI